MKLLAFASLLILFSECYGILTVNLRNQTVLRGDDVIIPCTYDADGITGSPVFKWFARPSATGTLQRLFVYYSDPMDGISAKDPAVERDLDVNDEGSLVLPQATLDDNDEYSQLSCEVDFGQPGDAVGSMTLSVVVRPEIEPLVALVATSFDASELPVRIGTCDSGSGFPAPTVSFLKDGKVVKLNTNTTDGETFEETTPDGSIDEFTHDFERIDHDDGTTTIIGKLYYPLAVADDKAVFTCQIKSGRNELTRYQEKDFEPIRVNHPTDTVTIAHSPAHAIVGERYVLTCIANGYPEPDITMNGVNSPTLSLDPVTKDDIDLEVTCQAADTFAYARIDVLYADTPVIQGEPSVLYGGEIELECVIDSNPPPTPRSISWKRGKTSLNDTEVFLMRSSATFDDIGQYTCTAANSFPTLTRTSEPISVAVNGILLQDPKEDVTGKVKETVVLTCTVTAHPEPTFVWIAHDNSTIPEGESVVTRGENNQYTSMVSIGPLDPTMSKGTYQCIVSSDVAGVESQTKIFLFPELMKQSSVSVALIIIILLILLLLVAVALAVLYNKGYICKKTSGAEDAEDISVQMNEKDAEKGEGQEAEDANDQKEDNEPKEKEEQEGLMQKNGDK